MARLTTLSLVMGLPMRNYGAFTPKAEAVVVRVATARYVFSVDIERRVFIKETARRTFAKDTRRRVLKAD